MSYTESVQELVEELRQGKYLPVQQRAADAILLQAWILDTLTSEVERLSGLELDRPRVGTDEVIAFGMRE